MALTPEELEDLAFRGDPMPETDSQADELLFLCFRNLYAYAKKVQMPPEQGKKEKAQILDKYRRTKFGESVLEHNIEISKRLEMAAAAYVYNPCVETADKMYEAFYGIKRNEKPRGMSLEDFLAGKG